MQISGIQKTTLLDYPGKVACTIFTAGCNFRCPFCHNPEQVLPERVLACKHDFIPDDVFFNFLDTRKDVLDGVVVCGWEPTLQKDLYDFISKVKNKGFLVKLDTNGQDADIVQKLLDDQLLDYVAMDIKNPYEQYEKLVGVKLTTDFYTNYHRTIQMLLSGDIDYEFRTTVIKWHHDNDSMAQIAKSISWAKKYFIQNFVPGTTLDPDFEGQSLLYLLFGIFWVVWSCAPICRHKFYQPLLVTKSS